ncbi:LCP family protein [Pseudarthrobacter sp. J1763]|uniref:LCP family protein n=1 Tax=Pseudarthrobacter sp. J1763 TaxID=3420445 RepID=UPI003D2DE6B7
MNHRSKTPLPRPRAGDVLSASKSVDAAPRASGTGLMDPLRNPQLASVSSRKKRAFALILMTLFVPGTAQLVAGNRRLGRAGLRTTLVAWGLVVALIALALVSRASAVNLLTHPIVSLLLMVLLVALAIAWAFLFLNTLRIIRPGLLPQDFRPAVIITLVIALVLSSGSLLYAASLINAGRNALSDIFGSGPAMEPADGRYNIALLGGDAGEGREGLRPDSMSVLSIDANTGATAIISVPRSLQYAKFPADSPMHKIYPDGFNNCEPDPLNCLLNAVYTDATNNHKDAYPGASNPGAEATKDAIAGTLGIKIQAYVLIDMNGFAKLIDAMGGIKMRVGAWVPISAGMLPGSDTRHVKPDGWIAPGNQTLNGFQAQWFARSRENVDDFARVRRQQCVQEAMIKQLDPATVLTKFEAIAKAGTEVIDTDLPQGQLGSFIDLAAKAKNQPVQRLTIGPPDFPNTFGLADPDFNLIHTKVEQAIAKATGSPSPSSSGMGPAIVDETGKSQSVAPAAGPQADGVGLAAPMTVPTVDNLPSDFPLSTTTPDGQTITKDYLNSLYDAQDYAMLDTLLADNGNCAAL